MKSWGINKEGHLSAVALIEVQRVPELGLVKGTDQQTEAPGVGSPSLCQGNSSLATLDMPSKTFLDHYIGAHCSQDLALPQPDPPQGLFQRHYP